LNIRNFYTYLISPFTLAIKLVNLAQLCAELMNVGCWWCEFIVESEIVESSSYCALFSGFGGWFFFFLFQLLAWHSHFEGNCIQLEFRSFNVWNFLLVSGWRHFRVDDGAVVHVVGFSLDGEGASSWFNTFHLLLFIWGLIVFGKGVADLDLAIVLIRLVFIGGLEICGLISGAFFVDFTGGCFLFILDNKDVRFCFINLWLLEISYQFWLTVTIGGLGWTHIFWGFQIIHRCVLSLWRIVTIAFCALNFKAWLFTDLLCIFLSLLLFELSSCGLGSLLLVNALLSLRSPWSSFHIHVGWILGFFKMASTDRSVLQREISWCWVGCWHPYWTGIAWGLGGHEGCC